MVILDYIVLNTSEMHLYGDLAACVISRVTNKDSWEAVQVGFPKFATEERLKSFTGLIKGVRPEVPQFFRDYCLAAIKDAEGLQGDNPAKTISKDGCHCTFVRGSADTITKRQVQEQMSSFQGAAVVVAVCNAEVSLARPVC